jgi:excisionase family DNA binding protein
MENFVTTAEAAEILGVSDRRVRALIEAGRLPVEKLFGKYLIRKTDLTRVEERTPGRPPAPKAAAKAESAKNGKKPAKKARKARKR